ncbi:diaminopimelate epimerase [Desulfohalobiaceae bacterium Ax17]|jgi:diaminopimelate epimerase|uniref:diaminopimelate epimerase n=1 Tax=Desulfovulcanus ferrireducens TaxID=2831190 RepID=UPI00207BC131|nr:diaminopimelate epimerase [Desulfovulcanus ferrireducens]MBT8762428.1 diaminopimelate epimerase [Desulfovulcanus ferrireducens]
MTENELDTAQFFKMQGSGNDFILFDNRELRLSPEKMGLWAKKLCPRAFAIGADGMIFLDEPDKQGIDYRWHFFNSDGSRAEMCGNGSRCAARLAYELGMAPKKHIFGTDAGPIQAQVLEEGQVKVQLTPPRDLQLNLSLTLDEQRELNVHFVNTGVPHAVVITKNLQKMDVQKLGQTIRFHTQFSPAGTNVNFIEIKDNDKILLRTYERGVESETYACGTGAAASVVVANRLGLLNNSVQVTTTGGEVLRIILEDDKVFLQGKAVLVYEGRVFLKQFGLDEE